jgi:hypothetical protein
VTVSARRPPLRRSRRLPLRALLAVGGLAIAFGVGVAVGEALHDNPSPGHARTFVRTLEPLPLSPAPATVTVTRPRS